VFGIVELQHLSHRLAVLRPDRVGEGKRGGKVPQHDDHRKVGVAQRVASLVGLVQVVRKQQRVSRSLGRDRVDDCPVLARHLLHPFVGRVTDRLETAAGRRRLPGSGRARRADSDRRYAKACEKRTTGRC
jgi:hypothetical protein